MQELGGRGLESASSPSVAGRWVRQNKKRKKLINCFVRTVLFHSLVS